MTVVTDTLWLPSQYYDGPISGPRLLVIHCAENPLGSSAMGTARYFASGSDGRGVSAHYVVDPSAIVQCVHTYDQAYHVGPNANEFTLGYEQSGYTAYVRSQWLTPVGFSQLVRLAEIMAEDCEFYDIPVRWASDVDIRQAAVDPTFKAGICGHKDITRVLGGTTHTDPGTNYPADVLLSEIRKRVNPVTPPKPVPAPFDVTFSDQWGDSAAWFDGGRSYPAAQWITGTRKDVREALRLVREIAAKLGVS